MKILKPEKKINLTRKDELEIKISLVMFILTLGIISEFLSFSFLLEPTISNGFMIFLIFTVLDSLIISVSIIEIIKLKKIYNIIKNENYYHRPSRFREIDKRNLNDNSLEELNKFNREYEKNNDLEGKEDLEEIFRIEVVEKQPETINLQDNEIEEQDELESKKLQELLNDFNPKVPEYESLDIEDLL